NGASDNCIVEKCRFIGNYSTAAIVNDTAACTDLLIDDLTCKVKDNEPGIEVHADCTGIIRNAYIESTGLAVDSMIVAAKMSWFKTYGVTADGTAAAIIGGGEVQAALNTAVSQPPTANSLHDMLHKDGSYTYNNTTDSLEAIADAVGGISSPTDVTDAVPDTPTGNSLQDILSKLDGANTYDNTTDSLEAISDKVTAITDNVSAAVDEPPTAKSLHDILHKDGSYTFDNTTDSLEAIRDLLTLVEANTSAAVDEPPVQKSLHDILHKDGSYTFDNTTDSLEAIRDYIVAGTGVTTAIEADLLHFLASAADGGGNLYPDSVVNDSVLAFLMAKGNPANITSFDNSTDSLEAISDLLRTGSTVLTGIQLDTLAGVDTTVAADGDLTAHCLDGTLLAHILSATANTSTYQCSTDSLEAIAVALAAGTGVTTALAADQLDTLTGTDTGVVADGDLEPHCVSGSLVAHILSKSKDATDYKCTTDSLQAISDKSGAFSGDGGAAQDDSAKASLDLAHTDLDAILADTSVIDPLIAKSATKTKTDLTAASGETILFTVSGGPVKVTSIVAVVANVIKAVAINCKVTTKPTTPGNAVDVTGTVDINAAAVGSTLTPGATFGAALVLTANGVIGDMGFDFVTDDGSIIMNLDANGDADDSIEWYIRYEPLVSGATIVAA
ncbi:hypothetical protein LCGC14_1973830, partial [marine sediment metagenome]